MQEIIQVNMRIDLETKEQMDSVAESIERSLGLKLSSADLLRMGLHLLQQKYGNQQ